MNKKLFALVLVCSIILAAACSQDAADETESVGDQVDQSEHNAQNGDDAEHERKEVIMESVDANAPEDQGDFDVWLQGEAIVEDKRITIEGTTNLLPGARIMFSLKAIEGAIIGSSASAVVDENGAFRLESTIPGKYDYPLIYAEMTFQPDSADEALKEHYAESGDNLEGPFVRLYEEDEQLKKQIALHMALELRDEQVIVPIEAPEWNIPDDYGSSDVRIETEVTEDGQFVYINGKSNLLEGSYLRGDINIPGYIAPGFADHGFTNPDGSFHMAIPHPQRKIDDVQEYELLIRFFPEDGNNFTYIYETYGEQGEKLTGDLVEEENDAQLIALKQKVTID